MLMTLFRFTDIIDFNAVTGENEESTSDGYIPERMVDIIPTPRNRKIRFGFSNKLNSSCFPDISLNSGINNVVRSIEKSKLMHISIVFSPKNWWIRLHRFAPITFLIPTSLALPSDMAVERFTKFTLAINKTIQMIISKRFDEERRIFLVVLFA